MFLKDRLSFNVRICEGIFFGNGVFIDERIFYFYLMKDFERDYFGFRAGLNLTVVVFVRERRGM